MNETLKRTPLYELHLKLGARMVPFGGWEMPVQYSSVIEEHRAVRQAAGLFDVSHMGEFEVRGPQALDLIQLVSTNDASKLAVGRVQYALMCYENGTVVDDILVYRLDDHRYWLVVNAGNTAKDWEWINTARERAGLHNLEIIDRSQEIALLALQGPLAEEILQPLAPGVVLSQMAPFSLSKNVTVTGVPTLVISRTGYTGEDGFEIYVKAEEAAALWEALLDAGEEKGLLPCGLGARDTLRFEARLPLYGHEISEQHNPLEAGLGFAVKLKKDVEFIGREALVKVKEQGLTRKLVGLEMIDRGIPRQGYPVAVGGEVVGEVTTGSFSPTLGKNIALAYVPVAHSAVGAEVEVIIRGKPLKARVVETPFYRSPHKR